MSMEADLQTLLVGICPRCRVDFFSTLPTMPYVTWQLIGGRPWRWLDNTPADKRQSRVQVNVFSATRKESLELIRQIEEAMCASTSFTATPDAEPMTDFDADMAVYEAIQDFLVVAPR